MHRFLLWLSACCLYGTVAILCRQGVTAERPPWCSVAVRPGTTSAVPPGVASNAAAQEVYLLQGDCSWQMPDTARLLDATSPKLVIAGLQELYDGPNHPAGVLARRGGPPAVICAPGSGSGPSSAATAGYSSGGSLALVNVVVAGCQLPAPTAGAGVALRPRGLLPAAAASSSTSTGPALVLQDVRVVVDAPTLAAHIAYFRQQQTRDVWTTLWLYTDGTSFLHVTWWSDGVTTWKSVGLLLADSLEEARATGQPPAPLPAPLAAAPAAAPAAATSPAPPTPSGSGADMPAGPPGGLRRHLQQQRGAPGPPGGVQPGPLNYVLWADNTTFVPQLLGLGGINTSVPLLVYQTSNITLGGPSREVAVFRPFYWVGLSSANTSVDLEMSTNQLLLTGRWSNLTSDHLVVENLATGDERSVLYADPVALDCTNCLWYLAFDRREFRHCFINSTMVVPVVAPDFNATLYWASLLNSHLPFFRTQAKFMREVYQMAALEVVVLEPSVSMLVLRGRSRTALMLTSIMSVAPWVAPELPLPKRTRVGSKVTADATGISPVVKSAATAKELQGVLSAPLEPLARSTLVLLVSNITLPPPTRVPVTCTQTLIGPYGTEDAALAEQPSDTYLNLSYAQGVLELPTSPPPSAPMDPGQSQLTSSGSTDDSGQGSCLTLQHMTLLGLAQGEGASKAGNLSDPSVWTLLLWGINRPWHSTTPPLGIVTVAMLLPAPEFDLLLDLANSNSAMVLPVSGGNDLVLTGASQQAPGRLYVSSLSGAGLLGTNITLLRQPLDAYTAATGAKHYWPHNGQTPFGDERSVDDGSGNAAGGSSQRISTGAVVAITVCAACAGMLLLGLAAWCCCRRRRPLPPPPEDAKQTLPYQNGNGLPSDVDSSHCRDQNGSQQRAMIVANSHSDDSSGRGDVEQAADSAGVGAAAATSTATGSTGSGGAAAPRRSNSGSLASTAAMIASGAKRVCAAIANRSQQAHEARLRTAMVGLQAQSRASATDSGGMALSERSSMGSSSQRGIPNMRQEDGVQLLGLLGRGAFAVVYKGVWRGRMVAVKVLHMTSPGAVQQLVASVGLSRGQEGSHGSRLRQMAVTEVAMGAALKHPNIVQVYTYSLTPVGTAASYGGSHAGAGSSRGTGSRFSAAAPAVGHSIVSYDGQPSSGRLGSCDLGWELRLVMEYCDQGTLREALDRGTFAPKSSSGGSSENALLLPDLRSVLPLAVDLMSALVHLHSEGILHGDLKAANVLLSHATAPEADDGNSGMAGAAGGRRALRLVAKVADFGLSTALEAERTHISHVHGGTLTHMAPELLLTGRASQASDMYAAGILLWELVTGLRPWEGVGPALLPARVVQQGARPLWPPGCEQHIPQRLRALTEAAWAQEPAARPDATYMVQQLEQLQEELTWQHLFGMQGLAG